MLNSKSILFFFAIAALLLGVTPAYSQAYSYSGSATIDTANCSDPGGLCQGGDPAACNGGRGPNNGAGTPNCSTASPTPTPVDNCPACNNGAGPAPAGVRIQASVTISETPTTICAGLAVGTLTANGTGQGFVFGKTYISLLYKNPNAKTCSRFPANVFPTLENAANPLSGVDNDFASMMLGFWIVKPDGTATLTVAKQPTVSGLNNYTTVSVREVQPPNTTCFNCGLDPAPQLNALRACGALTVAATPIVCN
jgi:hypothetical protein